MGSNVLIATLVAAVWLTSVLAGSANAQSPFKVVDDWAIDENRNFDGTDPPPAKGIADEGFTNALNGRKATISVRCTTYYVNFVLGADKDFWEAAQRVPGNESNDFIFYTKTNREQSLGKTLGWAGYEAEFWTNPAPLIRGANFMICPTRDENDPVCLNFSLKGFTAVLKMICPKR